MQYRLDQLLTYDSKVGVPLWPWGAPQAPLWSLVNIKCVAANIMCGVANILRGSAYILHGTLSIYFEQCLTFCMSNTIWKNVLGLFKGIERDEIASTIQ